MGRFQQKQTVEHLEGLVIGTGIPGVESLGWRNGCFKSETVRPTSHALMVFFVPMLRCYFCNYGLFGENARVCYLQIFAVYIYMYIYICIYIYRIFIVIYLSYLITVYIR